MGEAKRRKKLDPLWGTQGAREHHSSAKKRHLAEGVLERAKQVAISFKHQGFKNQVIFHTSQPIEIVELARELLAKEPNPPNLVILHETELDLNSSA